MDYAQLTEARLYAIMKNDEMNASIRTAAETELKRRNISSSKMEALILEYDALLIKKEDSTQEMEPLSLKHEFLQWLNPFQFPFYWWANMNSKLQQKGKEKQRRKLMFYYCALFLLLTIIVIIWAKYHLIKAV